MASETLGVDETTEVLDRLGLPGDVEALVLEALEANRNRQPSDMQDQLPEAPEESVFDERIWNLLKTLAEEHGLPADSQSIADAETLILSHHPAGDTGVLKAMPWSRERKRAARTLANNYHDYTAGEASGVDMAVIAPIHALGDEGDIEPSSEALVDIALVGSEQAIVEEPEQAGMAAPAVQSESSPLSPHHKRGMADKRWGKQRAHAGDTARPEPHEIKVALGDFDTIDVSDQQKRVVGLLADTFDITPSLVASVLSPDDTSRLKPAEASALLRIRNALGFIPNKKLEGYKHFGILPEIKQICNTHDVNALLGGLLGFRFAVEGSGAKARRAVVTTGLQLQRMGIAVKSPRAASPRLARRGILKGLMIIGLYADAEKAAQAEEAAG